MEGRRKVRGKRAVGKVRSCGGDIIEGSRGSGVEEWRDLRRR